MASGFKINKQVIRKMTRELDVSSPRTRFACLFRQMLQTFVFRPRRPSTTTTAP